MLKLGTKVKVIKPSEHSDNRKNRKGKVLAIEEGALEGFGECIIYFVGTPEELANREARYEHETGLEIL